MEPYTAVESIAQLPGNDRMAMFVAQSRPVASQQTEAGKLTLGDVALAEKMLKGLKA